MNNQEAIEVIKLAQAQIEWDYPMDYTVAFDMAISALQEQEAKHSIESSLTQNALDLISRQAAIVLEPPERYEWQYQTMNLDDAYESGWYDAQAGISQLPPADVRPVVTCAECDWHVDCGYHFCNKWCQPCPDNADFYCAYGERPTAVPT